MWYLSADREVLAPVDYDKERFAIEMTELYLVVYYNKLGRRTVLDCFETLCEAQALMELIARKLDAVYMPFPGDATLRNLLDEIDFPN